MASKFVHCIRFSYPRVMTGALNNKLSPNFHQSRTIVTKLELEVPDDYPEPWPYRKWGYSQYMMHLEKTKKRFHKNSKLIVVESNIGVGRSALAKELADVLGFHYMPAFKMDDILIDRYNIDMRDYYHLFPKRFRFPDVNMFYRNPADDQTAVMQDLIYDCRWEQYLNAQAHIFNTGQGVVLERCVHADFVFANAMRAKDWISKEYFNYYMFKRKQSLHLTYLFPNLIIFLDCEPEKCLENIKKRGNPDEINAVDLDYLVTIHNSYKDFLYELKGDCFIIERNWSIPGDINISLEIEALLEEIYKLNFDVYERQQGNINRTWNSIGEDLNYCIWRHQCTSKDLLRSRAMNKLGYLHTEVAELYIYPMDGVHHRNVIMHEVLKDRCTHGYTKRDPIQGLTRCNYRDMEMPERWTEYFWNEQWIGSSLSLPTLLDPTALDYDPEYLSKH